MMMNKMNKYANFNKLSNLYLKHCKSVFHNNSLKHFNEKFDKEKFFYEGTNMENQKQNVISVKSDSKLKKIMNMEEPGEQPLIENEAYRELYKNFSLYVNEENSKEIDTIQHNEEVDGKKYKYGLLAKNELQFTELIPQEEVDELPKTASENLFELLDLDKESSFESLVLKIQQEFNHEADMYGNIVKAGETNHKVFQYGVPIPLEVIKDDKVMNRLRNSVLYNRDLPGNIQDIHPNKFIANLRPVEEFRHTPVVPISERDMKEFKKRIEEKNRMGVYLEIKKQTIYYYGIAVLFAVILYLTFKYFYNESEKMQAEIQRIRLRRLRYRQEEDIN